MICYRDKAFCDSDCNNRSCHRYITDTVVNNADRLGLPLSKCDMSNDCHEYMKPNEEKQDE